MVRALRHRDLRRLLGALTISDVGTWAYLVVLLTWVHEQTDSYTVAAAATAARFVPALVLSPLAGVLAERSEKVPLVRRVDALLAVLMAVIGLCVWTDASVWVVVALSVVVAAVSTVYEPAIGSLIPLAVGEDDLAGANSLRSMLDNLTVVIGPALAGLLLVVASTELVVALNAASYAASAVLVATVRIRGTATDVSEGGEVGLVGQLATGVRAVRGSGSALALVGCSIAMTVGYGLDTVLLLAIAEDLLGGEQDFGPLLAGLGIGGLVAAPLVPVLERRTRLAPAILIGMVLYFAPLAVLLVTDRLDVAVAMMVVRGAGTLVVDVLALTELQRALDGDVLARVLGLLESVLLGSIVLGTLGASALLLMGTDAAVLAVAVGASALCLLAWPALVAADRTAVQELAEVAPEIEVLAACDLFEDLPAGALAELAQASLRVTLEPGQDVIRQHDPADALWVLTHGRLAVRTEAEGELPELGPGDYLGEIGLLRGVPRTATVTTLTTCSLLRIDGRAFLAATGRGRPSASLLGRTSLRLSRTPSATPVTTGGPS
jgi:predicted MFS family arabinose efflux permease